MESSSQSGIPCCQRGVMKCLTGGRKTVTGEPQVEPHQAFIRAFSDSATLLSPPRSITVKSMSKSYDQRGILAELIFEIQVIEFLGRKLISCFKLIYIAPKEDRKETWSNMSTLIHSLFYFCFVMFISALFCDRAPVCGLDWSWTLHPSASPCQVLGLQANVTLTDL